jgi:hypothetical protein
MDMGLHREWQWENGSGTVGKRRSGRFEWYKLECGSGSISGVVVDWKMGEKKWKKCKILNDGNTMEDSLITSGSGTVAVVSLERGERGGSNGTGYNMAVAVFAEIGWIKDTPEKKWQKNGQNDNVVDNGRQFSKEWQWLRGISTVV